LFAVVCQAIQHAHTKGIIHRDIKPTNVLVTRQDGQPVVKVIDFGIAKAMGQQLTEKTLFTEFAQMIGTPLYMSPEQAELTSVDIDTRSDIYSLGVLLYELLTGTTPFDKERFQTAGYDEIRRIIREEDPARPSTRIDTLGQAASTVSGYRNSDPKELRRQFRGELDWIVMKCLEKDRNRRYETPAALAADVKRFLNDETVLACPPSALYRFGKLARRHKRALLSASVAAFAALLAVTALAVSAVLVWRANQDLQQEAYFQTITVAHRELSTDDLGRALRLLEDCPEDLRQWEWRYLMRLCRVEPLVLRDDTGVNGVAFSPDGRRIASAGGNGDVKIWDAGAGKVLQTISGAHNDAVVSVAFHPDGNHVASVGADREVKVWDLRTGQEVFRGPCDAIRKFGSAYTVAFRPPDGRQLAAGSSGVVRIWDWENGERSPLELPGHEYHSIPVAFSRDGRRLATGGAWRQPQKALGRGEQGAPLGVFPAHRHPVSALAFSPTAGGWPPAVSTGT
jgi:eukaryotic-like serine/threonine-protein kinase